VFPSRRLATKVVRQDALNALNPQIQRELIEALTELREDEHRALVVTGAGDQAFVAGADIGVMGEMSVLKAKTFSE